MVILSLSLLKSIETFKNYEWYQIVKTDNTYEKINKLLSMAGISTLVASKPKDLVMGIEEFNIIKPSANGFYNENFSINTNEIKFFDGGVVLENWCVLKNSFESFEVSWENIPETADLNLIFESEININKIAS